MFKMDPGSGFLGLPRSLGSRFSPVEGFNLPLNTHREFSW